MAPESGINALGAGSICSYSENVIKSKIIIIFNFGLISVFTKRFWKIQLKDNYDNKQAYI